MAQNAYTALEGVSPLSIPFLSFFLSFFSSFVFVFVCFCLFVLSYTLFFKWEFALNLTNTNSR